MSEAKIDVITFKAMILKLLDKAGNDPRLTPRILRNKTEDKLKLERGTLKLKRELIKTLIVKWWKANHPHTNGASRGANYGTSVSSSTQLQTEKAEIEPSQHDAVWKSLIKLARAAGKWPAISKNIDISDTHEKVKMLRKRLHDMGLKFSDVPTEAEIKRIEQDTQRKKDLDGLDPGLELPVGKKRKIGAHSSDQEMASCSSAGPHQTVLSPSPEAAHNITKATALDVSVTGLAEVSNNSTAVNTAGVTKKKIKYNSDEEEGDF